MDKFANYISKDYFYAIKSRDNRLIALSKPLDISEDKVSFMKLDGKALFVSKHEFNLDKYKIKCIDQDTERTIYNSEVNRDV